MVCTRRMVCRGATTTSRTTSPRSHSAVRAVTRERPNVAVVRTLAAGPALRVPSLRVSAITSMPFRLRLSGLLDTFHRIGVWPDSVQVLGGTLALRLPARSRVWLYSGLRTAGHRGAVWLKRGVPSSQ